MSAKVAGNIFILPAKLGASEGVQLVLDTGAPALLVRTPAAPEVKASAVTALASASFIGLEFSALKVVGLDFFGDSVALDGLLGCTVLCDFDLGLDYRAETVTLNGARPSSGLESEVALPVMVKGGGLAQLQGVSEAVQLAPSRILLNATVEGTTQLMMVDTGAGVTVIRSALAASLAADGRATLDTPALAMGGITHTTVMRTKSLAVGAAALEGLPVVSGATFDGLLDGLSQETGVTVDGLIGGAFLRSFYTSVGYVDGMLRLSRYTDQSHAVDEMRRVGIDLSTARTDPPGVRTVARVFPGSDAAAKGLEQGDRVTAIDGVSVSEIHALALPSRLAGPSGSTHELSVECRACAVVGGKVSVQVEDLVPLMR